MFYFKPPYGCKVLQINCLVKWRELGVRWSEGQFVVRACVCSAPNPATDSKRSRFRLVSVSHFVVYIVNDGLIILLCWLFVVLVVNEQ
jgi:hypothetical protein